MQTIATYALVLALLACNAQAQERARTFRLTGQHAGFSIRTCLDCGYQYRVTAEPVVLDDNTEGYLLTWGGLDLSGGAPDEPYQIHVSGLAPFTIARISGDTITVDFDIKDLTRVYSIFGFRNDQQPFVPVTAPVRGVIAPLKPDLFTPLTLRVKQTTGTVVEKRKEYKGALADPTYVWLSTAFQGTRTERNDVAFVGQVINARVQYAQYFEIEWAETWITVSKGTLTVSEERMKPQGPDPY